MSMKQFCYLNGKIIPSSKASLPLNDMAILRGYAAFDFFHTFNGKLFCFKDYYCRFVSSSKKLGLKVPLTMKEMEVIIYSLIKKNKMKDASVRLILTGGVSKNGFDLSNPNFFMLIEDVYGVPASMHEKGVKLVTRKYERLLPEAKTTNYLFPVKEKPAIKKEGAFEILYVVEGKVLECSFSNIFFFKGDTLITPKDDVLNGITRRKTIELAKKKFMVEEREVMIDELLQANEVFMTGSNKHVLPVVKIDTHIIADGKVGEKTKTMMHLFDEFTKK